MGHRKFAILFGLLALLCGWLALEAGLSAWGALYVSLTLSAGGLALAYSSGDARCLLKRGDGSLGSLSWLVYWPYHVLNCVLLRLVRWTTRENPFDEVAPGVFLGGRLLQGDRAAVEAAGIRAVLDLTGEFGELGCLRCVPAYLCVPLMDACPPSADDLRRCVTWLTEEAAHGAVYIHCASGHGRSATVAAAYLLSAGLAATPEAAVASLRDKRPGVGLQPSQYQALHRFAELPD